MLSRLPRSDNRLSVTPRKHGQRQKPQLFSPCREARFKDSDPWRFACFRGGADRALTPPGSRETMAPAKEHATLPLGRRERGTSLAGESLTHHAKGKKISTCYDSSAEIVAGWSALQS